MNFLEIFTNLKSIPKFLGNIAGLIGTFKIILKN